MDIEIIKYYENIMLKNSQPEKMDKLLEVYRLSNMVK
jgi:hypothetical protein